MNDHQAIETLWADQPGRFACLSSKDTDGRWRDFLIEQPDVDRFIKRHGDENCYFAPMKFSRARRLKDYAVLPHMLWADLDAVDPRDIDLKPTVAIQSSPRRFAALWRTDKMVSEDLNRRLTYALGADRGGWDLVQVLRLPGTRNFKYAGAPRVRLLWDDGPEYRVGDLEAKLPQLASMRTAPRRSDRRASRLTEAQILAKHRINGSLKDNLSSDGYVAREQRKVNEWLDHPDRRMQSSKELDRVQRWRMHYKLACELREKGVPASEAFVLLWGTAWNKHNDENSVWRLVEKCWGDDEL